MRQKAVRLGPLTQEEKDFAEENHGTIFWYLSVSRLDASEYYDLAALGFLQAVKKWFLRPELHRWSFRTIAFRSMQSYIKRDQEKQGRFQTVSLEEEIPGTDGITYGEIVTAANLDLYYTGGTMNIRYNVKVPERKRFGQKSDEVLAFENFRETRMKNMCIEYDTEEEAKKKLYTLQAYRRKQADKDDYEIFRDEKNIYIIKMKREGK